MAKTESTPHAPADAVTHSTTQAEIKKLRSVVNDIDSFSQGGFSAISTIAKFALARLETPAGYEHMDDLARAFEMIWEKAEDIQNIINYEAEQVGCNYTDLDQRRRWAAEEQARDAAKEVQHG